jgi:hypothetical protein
MQLLVLLLVFLALAAASLRWGADTRTAQNNWDRR